MKATRTGLCKMQPRKIVGAYRDAYVKAVGSAQGRAVSAGKTAGRRAVASASGIKQKAIKGRVSGSRGSVKLGKPAVIKIHLTKMPLEAFSQPRQTRRGVRAGKVTVPGGFLAKSTRGRTAGKQTVFRRVGERRGPIERQGVELVSHSGQFKVAARKAYLETYDKRFAHEYKRQLTKRGLA